jgi:lysozyme
MSEDDLKKLRDQLVRFEGLRLKPYVDTKGKITIGVGRNLTDVGIDIHEAYDMLERDIDRAIADCSYAFPWFKDLDPLRQRVWVDLDFNMGLPTLLKFPKMLAAAAKGDHVLVAVELMDSDYAKQVGPRAQWLADAYASGAEPSH